MTNPPEWDEPRTDTQRLADDIAHQASLIRREWDDVLDATAPAQKPGASTRKSATITLNDDDPRDADIDAATRLMHLRRNTMDVLNQWSRLVMEERPITNPESLPLGTDVEQMCAFIERQADWLSGTDYGPYALEELREIRWQVQAYTDPYKREWYRLGGCPLIVTTGDDQPATRFCRGVVRIKIGDTDDDATCTGCGQTAPVQWWEATMNADLDTGRVRAPRLAQILSTRLHVNVDERTIRRWAKSGKITAAEVDTDENGKPAYWFDPRTCMDEAARMDRQCPTCGRLWSGIGDVCGRCYATINHGQPRYADRPNRADATYAPVVRVPRVVVGKAAAEADVCHMSDLPMAWCACGRHAG